MALFWSSLLLLLARTWKRRIWGASPLDRLSSNDFEAKYFNAESRTVVNPELPGDSAERVRRAAVEIFKAVDGYGLARVDFFNQMDRNAPIGVFHSGVGGLTVMREIMRQMPDERIVYFGDTARVPYGNKSKETVIRYSQQIIRFLQTKEVKAIVIACNTASACALEAVEKSLDIPIIGVISAGSRAAVEATRNGKIGIIGTEATIRSGVYSEEMKQLRGDIEVTGKPCPLFVPLVEEGLLHDSVTDEIASRYLACLKGKYIDTLVMGCTHYPLRALHI